MKAVGVFLMALVATLSFAVSAATVSDEAIRMAQSGVTDDVIVAWAEKQSDFELTTKDIIALKDAKLSDRSVIVLIKASGRRQFVDEQNIIRRAPAADQQVVQAPQPQPAVEREVRYVQVPQTTYVESPSVTYVSSGYPVYTGGYYSGYYPRYYGGYYGGGYYGSGLSIGFGYYGGHRHYHGGYGRGYYPYRGGSYYGGYRGGYGGYRGGYSGYRGGYGGGRGGYSSHRR